MSAGQLSFHDDPIVTAGRFGGLVVPLDLEPFGDRALAIVRVLAARGALPVHLVTAVAPGIDDTSDRAALMRRGFDLHAHYVDVHLEPGTDVAEALAGAIGLVDSPLVCMASHGRSAVGAAVLGITTEDLLRSSRVPAVLVGPNADLDQVPSTLAVCVDPSGAPDELIDTALAWHEVFGGALRAVEVVEPDGPDREPPAELLDAARALRAPLRVLPSHDPARALVDLAADRDVLLAVGSHLRRGIARALLGSVAIEVVHRSPAPVLVVPGG